VEKPPLPICSDQIWSTKLRKQKKVSWNLLTENEGREKGRKKRRHLLTHALTGITFTLTFMQLDLKKPGAKKAE
jgi:hypothetical protein